MSLYFNKYVPPEHCQVKFEWKSGTPVRLQTLNDGSFEGEVLVNDQSNQPNPLFLELVNVVKLSSSKDKGPVTGCQFARFETRELVRVEVLGPPNVKSFPKKIEKLYETLIVNTSDLFDKVETCLKMEKPTEVGVNFYGLDVGRGGDLFLMVFFVMDTIIIMEYEKLSDQCKNLMRRLDTLLFSNEAVLKVAYNSRPIADWLYHYHSIYLKNVFDVQVGEFYLWARGQQATSIEKAKKSLQYRLLSDCLVEFIGSNVIPKEEIDLLKEFEGQSFNEYTHPLKVIPVPDKYIKAMKWVAIEIKHLLALREAMAKRMVDKFVDCVSTNMITHVGRREFSSSYDHSNRYAIPSTVIDKFIPSKGATAADATRSANPPGTKK